MDSAVQSWYARFAPSYDRSWKPFCESCWTHALPFLPDLAGKWVLDAGCGTGIITDRLANEVGNWGQVVGIDLCQEMIHESQRAVVDRRNVTLNRAPINAVPARDRSFDLVVCANVLHEVDDFGPALREWRRILNAGGEVVLLDYDGAAFPLTVLHRFLRFKDKAYRRCWRLEEAENALRNHGYTIVESRKASISKVWKIWLIRAKKE